MHGQFRNHKNKGESSLDEIKLHGDAEANFRFGKGTSFSFDGLAFSSDSLSTNVKGKFDVDDQGVSFALSPQDSTLVLGNSVISRNLPKNKNTDNLQVKLGGITSRVVSGVYTRLHSEKEGRFDFRLVSSGEIKSASLEQQNKGSRLVVSLSPQQGQGGAIYFNDVEVNSQSVELDRRYCDNEFLRNTRFR